MLVLIAHPEMRGVQYSLGRGVDDRGEHDVQADGRRVRRRPWQHHGDQDDEEEEDVARCQELCLWCPIETFFSWLFLLLQGSVVTEIVTEHHKTNKSDDACFNPSFNEASKALADTKLCPQEGSKDVSSRSLKLSDAFISELKFSPTSHPKNSNDAEGTLGVRLKDLSCYRLSKYFCTKNMYPNFVPDGFALSSVRKFLE